MSKSYGPLTAVDRLSFCAYPGEIFGLIGPNGAGKTTTLEMIEGLRQPDSAEIVICGPDGRRDRKAIAELIDVQLQSTSVYNKMRVEEALRLFGGDYRRRRPPEELLERTALQDKRRAYHMNLSGGQQQRFALALVHAIFNNGVSFVDILPQMGILAGWMRVCLGYR